VWLCKLVYGLFDQVLDSTVIYCDYQRCVKLLENPVFHDRPKHIESHYFKVHSCEKFRIMVHFEGWCRTIISIRKWSGQSFPRADSFYLGCTMVNVGGMA
jgi:hypothetical protein